MLDYVGEGVEARNVVFLNVADFQKPGGIELFDDLRGFFYCCAEHGAQFGNGDVFALVEFEIAVAFIGRATQAADDPLTDVSVEMEDEVADGVICFVGAPPEVVCGEFFEAAFDAGEIFFQKAFTGVFEVGGAEIRRHGM